MSYPGDETLSNGYPVAAVRCLADLSGPIGVALKKYDECMCEVGVKLYCPKKDDEVTTSTNPPWKKISATSVPTTQRAVTTGRSSETTWRAVTTATTRRTTRKTATGITETPWKTITRAPWETTTRSQWWYDSTTTSPPRYHHRDTEAERGSSDKFPIRQELGFALIAVFALIALLFVYKMRQSRARTRREAQMAYALSNAESGREPPTRDPAPLAIDAETSPPQVLPSAPMISSEGHPSDPPPAYEDVAFPPPPYELARRDGSKGNSDTGRT